ncbi:MAG: peptidoglycan DD-metalloendopeptidase family protein [Aquificales bacterium]|nr:peptidoglycan DD-metalloendopeptidase family protein [Aquificales bacterium]
MKWWILGILAVVCGLGLVWSVSAQETAVSTHLVLPGDTWTALSLRYGADVQAMNPHMNQQRQPAIGTEIVVPVRDDEQMGRLVRTGDGGLLATAVRQQTSPWAIALQNDLSHPYQPTFYQPLFLPGGEAPPRDLPVGFESLELSQLVAHPGQALGFRVETSLPVSVTAVLGDLPFVMGRNGRYQVGLVGTGAFYGSGEPELAIQVDGQPLWTQPWRFEDPNTWDYQELTYTGEAAEIDQAAIDEERARLHEVWSQVSPEPLWEASFMEPIKDYLGISSSYGARRSVNGGPYNRYHEGVDFSAYGGTQVLAPAGGVVVVAEPLYVRGGAVIIDHGLGVYSGYYHLSDILVEVGTAVSPGDVIGAVGTTGLSTGNHLHWDLLIGTVWVDAAAWLAQDMGCWILEGWGRPCSDENSR